MLRGSVLIFIRPFLLSKNSLKGKWENAVEHKRSLEFEM